jgi:hypothetical protein
VSSSEGRCDHPVTASFCARSCEKNWSHLRNPVARCDASHVIEKGAPSRFDVLITCIKTLDLTGEYTAVADTPTATIRLYLCFGIASIRRRIQIRASSLTDAPAAC